jgi:hypothetical protein
MIDNRLPRHVGDHYRLSGELDCLMDYRSDILGGNFLTYIHDAEEFKFGIDLLLLARYDLLWIDSKMLIEGK